MSCPFFGASIHFDHLFRFTSHGAESNQCALITSAHSPCWMEVGEATAPDWTNCPRNPEFVALNIFETFHTDVVSAKQADVRLLASVRHLSGLMRIRESVAWESKL